MTAMVTETLTRTVNNTVNNTVDNERASAVAGCEPLVAATHLHFTFDVEAGVLRRSLPDDLANRLLATGLDVSWTDARAGWYGRRRRFTIRGRREVVQQVITDIGMHLGWQPGAVVLPGITG